MKTPGYFTGWVLRSGVDAPLGCEAATDEQWQHGPQRLCYRLYARSESRRSWYEARDVCAAHEAKLAASKDADTNAWLQMNFKLQNASDVWLPLLPSPVRSHMQQLRELRTPVLVLLSLIVRRSQDTQTGTSSRWKWAEGEELSYSAWDRGSAYNVYAFTKPAA